MTKSGNLWAIGYDDMGRANQVRDEIISQAGGTTGECENQRARAGEHPNGLGGK
jgi:hypothetical protein